MYFQHPDDRNVAWLPKIVVVLGNSFAYLSVLLLPLDVSNVATSGGLKMDFLWMLVYMVMAGFCVVLVPFAVFYYEADDQEVDPKKRKSQTVTAIGYTFATLAIFLIWSGIFYATLGTADLDVQGRIPSSSSVYHTLFCRSYAHTHNIKKTSRRDSLQIPTPMAARRCMLRSRAGMCLWVAAASPPDSSSKSPLSCI